MKGVRVPEQTPPSPPDASLPSPPEGPTPASAFRFAEQFTPPTPVQASEVARTTFEHVYEVEPRLMERHVLQQTFPNWDTLRIMNSRHDHLQWMHQHFADTVITGSEILAEVDGEPT
jgi:hypothetical protein